METTIRRGLSPEQIKHKGKEKQEFNLFDIVSSNNSYSPIRFQNKKIIDFYVLNGYYYYYVKINDKFQYTFRTKDLVLVERSV